MCGSNRFRNHTCRTDVIFGYFGGLLSSPVFSILRDGVMISFAKIEKRCVEKTLGRARVALSFQFYFILFYFYSCILRSRFIVSL